MKYRALVLISSLSVASLAPALTILETESVWTGTFYNNTSTGSTPYHIGQSFTAPLSGDTVFDKGRLTVRSQQGRTVSVSLVNYNAGTSVLGSTLATQSNTLIGDNSWQQMVLDPADVALTPGGTYALMMSVTLTPTTFQVANVVGTSYLGGRYLVGQNNPGTIPNFVSDDTVFRVELVAVPEPATMAALGVGAFAIVRRRRTM